MLPFLLNNTLLEFHNNCGPVSVFGDKYSFDGSICSNAVGVAPVSLSCRFIVFGYADFRFS